MVWVDAALAVGLLLSAGACSMVWAKTSQRPEHRGEVAFLYIYALWAVAPGFALLVAALRVQREGLDRWRFLVQLTKGLGGNGLIPPELAAWTPSMVFGVLGAILFARVRT